MLGKFRITGYKNYITKEGDTFDALSLSMYNDEKYDYVIRRFNPDYCDVKYLLHDAIIEKILEDPSYIKTPVVRNGSAATVGYQPDVWKTWK